MRKILIVAAGFGLALTTTTTSASAAAGTATGPSGATYTYTTTCATRSMTANVDMSTATGFTGLAVENNLGGTHAAGGQPQDAGGNPITVTKTNWKGSAFYGEAGSTAFSLLEDASPAPARVAGPVSMSACPDYSGTFGSFFTPITPVRVLDTRTATTKNYTGAKPAAGALVTVTLAGASVPADAVAVALNVTATEATLPGYVQVFPTGRAVAGSSSNLNASAAGQTIANSVIVPIGDGGAVSFFTQTGTHLLADVAGYFRSTSIDVAAGRYQSIAPTRVLDTRPSSAKGYSGAKPGAKGLVTAAVAGSAGLPAVTDIAAVVLNVTATEATGPGFVQVAASGTLVPAASSSLNVERANALIPNMVVVPVSAAGKVDLYTQSGTHLLVDVLGWFSNASVPAGKDGLFVPMTPERVLDTRAGSAVNYQASLRLGEDQLKPAATDVVPVDFVGLPRNAGPVVLNITATEATAPGFVQAGAAGAVVPGASSNLNLERAGQTIPNAAIVPTDELFGIDIYTQNGTHVIADIAGFFTDPSRVAAA